MLAFLHSETQISFDETLKFTNSPRCLRDITLLLRLWAKRSYKMTSSEFEEIGKYGISIKKKMKHDAINFLLALKLKLGILMSVPLTYDKHDSIMTPLFCINITRQGHLLYASNNSRVSFNRDKNAFNLVLQKIDSNTLLTIYSRRIMFLLMLRQLLTGNDPVRLQDYMYP